MSKSKDILDIIEGINVENQMYQLSDYMMKHKGNAKERAVHASIWFKSKDFSPKEIKDILTAYDKENMNNKNLPTSTQIRKSILKSD